MAQTGYTFVPTHKPGNLPQTMGTTQEQDLRTERFQQKQSLFRRYTIVDIALKNQIVIEVQPVLLSQLVDQLIGFGQVYTIQMIQH